MVPGTPRGTIDGIGTILGCGMKAGDDGSDRVGASPVAAGTEVPGKIVESGRAPTITAGAWTMRRLPNSCASCCSW